MFAILQIYLAIPGAEPDVLYFQKSFYGGINQLNVYEHFVLATADAYKCGMYKVVEIEVDLFNKRKFHTPYKTKIIPPCLKQSGTSWYFGRLPVA